MKLLKTKRRMWLLERPLPRTRQTYRMTKRKTTRTQKSDRQPLHCGRPVNIIEWRAEVQPPTTGAEQIGTVTLTFSALTVGVSNFCTLFCRNCTLFIDRQKTEKSFESTIVLLLIANLLRAKNKLKIRNKKNHRTLWCSRSLSPSLFVKSKDK